MKVFIFLLGASAAVSLDAETAGSLKNDTETSAEDLRSTGWFQEFQQNYIFLLVVLIFIAVAYLLIRQDVVLLKKVQKLEKELGAYDSQLLSSESKEFSMEFYRQV